MHYDHQQYQHTQQLKSPATMASIFGVFLCIFVSTAGGFRNGIDANAALYFGRSISTGSYQHFGGYSPASSRRTTSSSLHAVLSLKQSMDLIKETVLLSDIVGHYVKDIQPKGRSDEKVLFSDQGRTVLFASKAIFDFSFRLFTHLLVLQTNCVSTCMSVWTLTSVSASYYVCVCLWVSLILSSKWWGRGRERGI